MHVGKNIDFFEKNQLTQNMNIFFLSLDPKESAEMHLDKHVVKMILEYCQLLSTAHRYLDGVQIIELSPKNRKIKRWKLNDERDEKLYKATHVNHPSAVWCRQGTENYKWLHSLLVCVCTEYTFRYGKVHKSQRDGIVDMLSSTPKSIPIKLFSPPTLAMPDECKIDGDAIASYQKYYNEKKQHIASWKKRNTPTWFQKAAFIV